MAALTDHDTIKGLDEAKQTAKMVGVELIRGVEVSCTHTLSGGAMVSIKKLIKLSMLLH